MWTPSSQMSRELSAYSFFMPDTDIAGAKHLQHQRILPISIAKLSEVKISGFI
jgi:hypothetical protein